MAENSTAEKRSDFGEPPKATAGYWLAEIRAYDKTFESWLKKGEAVVKRYRNETDSALSNDLAPPLKRFNILWSNVQTLQPAMYGRVPKPDITRTHKDKNPVARAAAVILERAVRDQINAGGFDTAMRAGRDDYLLVARGQLWVRYVPTYGEEQKDKIFLQADTAEDGTKQYLREGEPYKFEDGQEPAFTDDGMPYAETGESYRPVVSECVKQEHVAWRDFGHTPAPNWIKVRAVWKRELMTRDQLVERFGKEKGEKVALTKAVPNVVEEDQKTYGDAFKRAEVFEIWDKSTHKVIWVSAGYSDGPLDEIDDPLHLDGFFPCPCPLYGTTTTDSLVPVTDYDEYRAQADEIDTLTERIHLLTSALKVAGAYNGAFTELQKILKSPDNVLVPIDDWAMFADKGGVKGAIDFLPIKEIADVVVALTNIREQAKKDLFEISGVADIMRGQSDPNETLGAQQIKSQFGGMRIEDRQANVARFARDVVRITAEIVAEQFSPETLWDISGWQHSDEARALDRAVSEWEKQAQAAQQQQAQMMAQSGEAVGGMPAGQAPAAPPQMPQIGDRPVSSREAFDQAVELLRSDRLRGYTIDIETDSMVLEDQQEEKQSRVEFITSVTGFLREAVPAAEQYPALKTILVEILMFGVRGFKAGRSLEAAFEAAAESLDEAPQQQPDPAMAQAQADAEARQAELAMKAEAEKAKLALEQQKMQQTADLEMQKMGVTREMEQAKLNLEQMRLAGEREDKQAQLAIEGQRLQQTASIEGAKLQQSAAIEDKKLAQARESSSSDMKLRTAAQNKQIMDETTAELNDGLTGDDDKAVSPLAELSQGLTALAQAIAQGQNQMAQQIADGHTEQAEQFRLLAQALAAPKRVLRDPRTGRAEGVETVQ